MIPSQVRIFVCTVRQDMRRSFDGLALAVRQRLALDPESGALFVFASKRGHRMKLLWFDHNGYCLLYKRLHRARFVLPDAGAAERPMVSLDARLLAELIRGVAK
ncbi:MAG: IS66 family insertion sequence element accessory protein TnpB [Polyangiaceae bacterium]